LGEAREKGWIGKGSAVALFGDHQNDVFAAKANGVRAVAVATGVSGWDELAAAGPDFLLEDLRRAPLGEILTA
jgi:phosphoglycolate phosphatase-like HAD superfamily hydrolase